MIRFAGLTLAVLALLFAGCSKEEGPADTDHEGMQSPSGMPDAGHDGMDHGDMQPGAAAAALPEGANKVCPVSGDEVDAEVYEEYMGKKVYFCCDDCVAKFKADPETYFAKAYPDAGK